MSRNLESEKFRRAVEAQIFGKAPTQQGVDWAFIDHILCKTYGWDFYTLYSQPLPFTMMLVDQIVKEASEKEKQMRRVRK